MASFTEQAILRVVDQSTPQINKINAALKQLFATAKSLKSISINIKVKATGLEKTLADLKKLNALTKKGLTPALTAATKTTKQFGKATTLAANQATAGIVKASKAQYQYNQHVVAAQAHTKRLNQLQQQFTKSGVPRMAPPPQMPWSPPRQPAQPAAPGGAPRGGGGGPPAPPGGAPVRWGGGRTPGGAFLGGFGGGIGIGLGRLNESFGLVALAAYGAARALKAVAEAAYARDRAKLAVDTVSSQRQRDVWTKLDKDAKDRGDAPPALRYKPDQFNIARASFLGDVGNTEGIDPKSKEGAEERAERADVLARELFRKVVPGMFARDPTLSQTQAQEDLKKFVQTLGIATENMFGKDAQGKPTIHADAQRVMEGIRLGMIAAPDLTMGQIRTAMASVKSLGYTATPQAIAEILFNVSAKGQRAANEAYQKYKTSLGITDVGKLNTAIEQLGLFIPGTAEYNKKKVGRGKNARWEKTTVKAGTGIPMALMDPETGEMVHTGKEPARWWRLAYELPSTQQKLKEYMGEQAVGQLGPKATKKEKDAARSKAMQAEPTADIKADFINRLLSGARGTALQGILDAILGGPIAKSGIAQAGEAPTWQEVEKRMMESWSVQATNLATATSNAATALGELVANTIGLNNILAGMTSFVEQYPLTAAAMAVATGLAIGAAVVIPFASLVNAGIALKGAASAIVAAAGRLGGVPGAGAPGGPGGPGGPGKGKGKTGTLPGGRFRWGRAAVTGMGVVSGVATAAWLASSIYDLYGYLTAEGEEKEEQRVAAQKKELQQQLHAAQADAARLKGKLAQPMSTATAESQHIKDQKAKLAQLEERIAILQQNFAEPKKVKTETYTGAPETAPGGFIKEGTKPVTTVPVDVVPTVLSPEKLREQIDKAVKDVLKPLTPKKDKVPAPKAAPAVTAPAATAPTTQTAASLAALAPELAKTANSITAAVGGLNTAGTTFANVFMNAGNNLAKAGQAAADTLNDMAPGIGATIGNAAADAIRSAVSNLTVNVAVPTPGGNPGRNDVKQ